MTEIETGMVKATMEIVKATMEMGVEKVRAMAEMVRAINEALKQWIETVTETVKEMVEALLMSPLHLDVGGEEVYRGLGDGENSAIGEESSRHTCGSRQKRKRAEEGEGDTVPNKSSKVDGEISKPRNSN